MTEQITTNQESQAAFSKSSDDRKRLNQWIFENIHSYIEGKVLELNSGSGQTSAFFSGQGISLNLSDPLKANRDELRRRFKGNNLIKSVANIDLDHPDFEQFYAALCGTFKTLFALNIPDQIYHNKIILSNIKYLLRENGYLMLIAPAFTAMYHGMGEDQVELKQYNRKSLSNLLSPGFEIQKARYFNFQMASENLPLLRPGLSVLAVARKL